MGAETRPCGCGGGRPATNLPARQAKPLAYQVFTFIRPDGSEFASTSWGAFVISAQAAGVHSGRTVIRDMLGSEIVSERVVGTVSVGG